MNDDDNLNINKPPIKNSTSPETTSPNTDPITEHAEFDETYQKPSSLLSKGNIISLIIFFILLIGIGILIFLWSKDTKELATKIQPIESDNNEQIEISNETDFEGFSDGISKIENKNFEEDTPIKVIDKTTLNDTKKIENDDDQVEEEAKEPESEPVLVDLLGPDLDENENSVEYTYYISLNSSAAEKYSSLTYVINADGCDSDDIFISSNDFSGDLTDLKAGDTPFEIEINDDFLKSKSDVRSVTYELKNEGEVIKSGNINVARCKELEEKGEFTIEGPGIDKDLVDGKYHFGYGFKGDDDALEILDGGFSYKIEHDCEEWLDGQGSFDNDTTAKKEYINSGGFAENVDKDAFDDDDDLTEESTYKIYDKDGDLVFTGEVDVPKCK